MIGMGWKVVRGKSGLIVGLLVVAVLVLGGALGGISTTSATTRGSAPITAARMPHGRFPLWHFLSTPAFAVLRQGDGLGGQWGIYAYRSDRPGASRNSPCISAIAILPEGSLPREDVCERIFPNADAPDSLPWYLLLGREETRVNGHSRGLTVFASPVPVTANQVTLEVERFRSGARSKRVIKTDLLSVAQGKKARVAPFRYVTLALPFDACIVRMSGTDAQGGVLFDDDTGECPLAG